MAESICTWSELCISSKALPKPISGNCIVLPVMLRKMFPEVQMGAATACKYPKCLP